MKLILTCNLPWFLFTKYKLHSLFGHVVLFLRHNIPGGPKKEAPVCCAPNQFSIAALTYSSCTTIFHCFKGTSFEYGVAWTIFSTFFKDLIWGPKKGLFIWKKWQKAHLMD